MKAQQQTRKQVVFEVDAEFLEMMQMEKLIRRKSIQKMITEAVTTFLKRKRVRPPLLDREQIRKRQACELFQAYCERMPKVKVDFLLAYLELANASVASTDPPPAAAALGDTSTAANSGDGRK